MGILERLLSRSPRLDSTASVPKNDRLDVAMRAANMHHTPRTRRRLLDAVHQSTLMVPIPRQLSSLADDLADRLRSGEEVELLMLSAAKERTVWGVYSDIDSYHRFDDTQPFALVPAMEIIWTAYRNHMDAVTINAFNESDGRATIDAEELELLSGGLIPRSPKSADAVAGAMLRVCPLNEPVAPETIASIRQALRAEPLVISAHVFRAVFGYDAEHLALGLRFDPTVPQNDRNAVSARLDEGRRIVLKGFDRIALLPIWNEELANAVASTGLMVYRRQSTSQ